MDIVKTIINAVIYFVINITLGTLVVVVIWKSFKSKIKQMIAKAIEEMLWGSND